MLEIQTVNGSCNGEIHKRWLFACKCRRYLIFLIVNNINIEFHIWNLQPILVEGDVNIGPVCLQIISLKTTNNTATVQFSDTKYKTEPIKLDLPDPTVLQLHAVVKLSYTLERSESSTSSEK